MEEKDTSGRSVHLSALSCHYLDIIRRHISEKAPMPPDMSDGRLAGMLIKHYMERHHVDEL